VVTDALNMGALTNEYSYEEIYVKSINAGVDLLLMPNGSKAAIEIIKKNVSEERINESVRKILTFKYTYLDDENVLDKSFLGSKEHKKVLDKISY
jgi:beta-N-acetylhexosaminidase